MAHALSRWQNQESPRVPVWDSWFCQWERAWDSRILNLHETVEATESMHEEEVNLLSLRDSIQIYFVNFDMVLKKRIVI